MASQKTDNELIEEFYVSQGGKPTAIKADVDFYQSDWNMLMPVVERIQNLDRYFAIATGFTIIDNLGMQSRIAYCVITNSSKKVVGKGAGTATLIEATYRAVVEFIKWYNEQKPS